MNAVTVQCPQCGAKNRVPDHDPRVRPVCGKCKAPLEIPRASSKPVDVTDATFSQEVLAHPGPVLVDCWAPWCGPCRMVAPVLERLAADLAGKLKVAKLDVDQNPATASRYGIQSIPALLLFMGGKEMERLVGALPRQDIEARIRPYLK